MGAGNSGSNSGGNTGPANRYKTPAKKAVDKVADFVKGGGFVGTAVRGVSGAIQKSKTDKALQGTSDYQGSKSKSNVGFASNDGGGNDNNTQPVIIKKNIGGSTIQTTAPTTAEVSQSEAANADAAALKVKKRGRSQSIMTSSQGVTKKSADYSLGKSSLLGKV
jgi:hypothetical protein